VDTTAENTEKSAEKAVKFLLTALDVSLFLLETVARSAGPILMDGGKTALARATEAFVDKDSGRGNAARLAARSRLLRQRHMKITTAKPTTSSTANKNNKNNKSKAGSNISGSGDDKTVEPIEDTLDDSFVWTPLSQLNPRRKTTLSD
jgi:hypothetical protein